ARRRRERLQGTGLRGEDLVRDLVDDIADCLVRQVRSQRGSQMVFDIADSSIPPAYREMIISSNPPSRRVPLGTSIGVNVPARSRGIASSTSPTSVFTVLPVVPLRAFFRSISRSVTFLIPEMVGEFGLYATAKPSRYQAWDQCP